MSAVQLYWRKETKAVSDNEVSANAGDRSFFKGGADRKKISPLLFSNSNTWSRSIGGNVPTLAGGVLRRVHAILAGCSV